MRVKKYEQLLDLLFQGKYDDLLKDPMIIKAPALEKNILLQKELRNQLKNLIIGTFDSSSSISSLDVKISHSNELLMDSSKKLNEISSTVYSALEEINSTQQSITSNYNQLFEFLQDNNKHIEQITKNVDNSTTQVVNINSAIEEVHTKSSQMKYEVEGLINITKDVNTALDGIANIAEQTNLLALNASIEAARAGEYGKGFSIVAMEIRKLSEDTSHLIETLSNLLNRIENASVKSSSSVQETIENIVFINNEMSSIKESSLENKLLVQKINQSSKSSLVNFNEFKAATEEVSSAIEEISEQSLQVNNLAETLSTIVVSLSELIDQISFINDKLTDNSKIAGSVSSNPIAYLENNKFENILHSAIKSHKIWMDLLSNIVNEMVVYPIQTDDTKCAFGHYYHAIQPQNKAILPIWESIDELHHKLHYSAKEVISFVKKNDSTSARSLYKEIEGLSEKINDKFQTLINLSKELTFKDEEVFLIY